MATAPEGCIDPQIGKLSEAFALGELLKPGQEDDLQKYRDHMLKCAACFDVQIEAAHQLVGLPMLRLLDAAREYREREEDYRRHLLSPRHRKPRRRK